MHDIAGIVIINATVLTTTYWRKRTLDRFSTAMLGHCDSLRLDMSIGTDNFRCSVICKLDAIQHDMRNLRTSYREQHQK